MEGYGKHVSANEEYHIKLWKKEVLSNININLGCGIYGLLGENGAGKTSLLKILCGLMSPTGGSILYNGSEIGKMGITYRVNIGYLPQVTPYYPDFPWWIIYCILLQ